mgnify:CR=1 FL=1
MYSHPLQSTKVFGAEVVTNSFLEIRKKYRQTNRIKEISKVEDDT